MPEPSCAPTVGVCSLDGSTPESCSFSPLSVTIQRLSKDCGVDCGRMSLGLHSGCVAAVNALSINPLAPQTVDGAQVCLNERLLGTRWDCAPDEGWVSIYLGSCTVH